MFREAQDVASWHSVSCFYVLMIWLPEKAEVIQANASGPVIPHTVRGVTVLLLLMRVNPGHTGKNLHRSTCEAGRSVPFQYKQITSFYVNFSEHSVQWLGHKCVSLIGRDLSAICQVLSHPPAAFLVASPCNEDFHQLYNSLLSIVFDVLYANLSMSVVPSQVFAALG